MGRCAGVNVKRPAVSWTAGPLPRPQAESHNPEDIPVGTLYATPNGRKRTELPYPLPKENDPRAGAAVGGGGGLFLLFRTKQL